MDAFRSLLQQVSGFVWAYVKRGLDSVNFEHVCGEKLQAGGFGRKKGAWRFYKGKPCFLYTNAQ